MARPTQSLLVASDGKVSIREIDDVYQAIKIPVHEPLMNASIPPTIDGFKMVKWRVFKLTSLAGMPVYEEVMG